MKRNRIENMSYCIHSFMTGRLGLGGGVLLVYAIIYSFTKGERGLFYGTQDFLAEASGLSISTVKRSLSSLLGSALVEKCTVSGKEGYRCTEITEDKPACTDSDAPPNDAEEALPSPKVMKRLSLCATEFLAKRAARPKYEFHSVGAEDMVAMTAEQYKRLLALVGPEALNSYIRRLEILIRDKGYRTFSPYKTIKKWIYEDAAL